MTTRDPSPLRGLPPLAGLTTLADAARPGLSVEACVGRLRRFHHAFKRIHQILTGRLIAEPIYELKTAFAHHAYLCSEHVQSLRDRVGEMRQPPLGLEESPDAALDVVFDEIRAAPSTAELVVGIYAVALPALDAGFARHAADTNPLTDAPTVRLGRFARLELGDMIAFGEKAVAALVDEPTRAAIQPWVDRLEAALRAAGELDGTAEPSGEPAERTYSREESAEPYRFDVVPQRDERFQDLFNQGVNAEAFLYDPALPDRAKALMMLYKRIREIDVPEMMASILVETPGKPWGYYRDMTRQLWDEARHAMMGEVGFVALGVDWTNARITHNWSLRLNTECTPLERHGVLYFIEQGLMPKTGKKYEWEVGVRSGHPLMATIQDYDWADEVLHAQIGRLWYLPQFAHWRDGLDFGDKAWSRILSNWDEVRDQGLTEHRNWWPDLYLQACAAWGEEPDPAALAFRTTYSGKRADLKTVEAASG